MPVIVHFNSLFQISFLCEFNKTYATKTCDNICAVLLAYGIKIYSWKY